MNTKTTTCFAVDAGNRFTKIADSNGFRGMFPSYWVSADYRSSEKISYRSGSNPSLIGEWIIGENAKFSGTPPIFYSEKSSDNEAPYLIFGAISLAFCNHPVSHIQKLKICLPDQFNKSQNQKLIQALKGTHQLSFGGNDFTVKISSVQIEAEGIPAYRFLRKQGAFKYPSKINGILDMGGGNSNANLFSPSGQPIWESRLVLPGTMELAKNIAQSEQMLGAESKVNSPRIEIILDSIESGNLLYGDRSFKAAYEKALKQWLKSMQAKMLTQWGEWIPNLAEIAIIGGSQSLANLLVTSTGGRAKIVRGGQSATVEGMLL